MKKKESDRPISCSSCKTEYTVRSVAPPRFCPFCNTPFPVSSIDSSGIEIIDNRYRVVKSIGKGGMGEVLLTHDISCDRQIALKRVRPDLAKHLQVQNRFLKEALITAQLTHPAIIPIYTIHGSNEGAYYTMPFVEGETLKQIVRKTRHQEKTGEKLDYVGGSIPALMQIFITICRAVAYAHSKGFLHRDLKPENIIVGKYGEVIILDWGLAKHIHAPSSEPELTEIESAPDKRKNTPLTRSGKVVGTIAYMAPEIAFGTPSGIRTDIYALGAILYRLLTLKEPFKRPKTLEEFKKTVKNEEWTDPIVAAPYRDIPQILSRIAKKCMDTSIANRYETVDELIRDLADYTEGRSEWFFSSRLDVNKKDDWEFQENVLIAEHMAITRISEESEWVSLMISRSSFSGNSKIETEVCIKNNGNGIGFLLSIPESEERVHINDGYCLWLGSNSNRSTKLLRSNVEVVHAPDIFLKQNQTYRITIEKIEQSIHLYIDDVLQLTYIAHLPLVGTHIGILARDADFTIGPLDIFVGSVNLTVNCLAVPDAFLAHRDFNQALIEYRRIAYSFPDRTEGREAIFKIGLTYIEQAKSASNAAEKEKLLDMALEKFEELHSTPAGPLGYLGKSLVYRMQEDEGEEIKCFEIAYRKYPKHPLLPVLQEQIISRMHEVSRHHRSAAYRFVLLACRNLPLHEVDTHTGRLFKSLQKHWEQLPFIEENPIKDKRPVYKNFEIKLAFWLAKPYILEEIIRRLAREDTFPVIEAGNALFSLIELGATEYAEVQWRSLCSERELPFDSPLYLFEPVFAFHEKQPWEDVLRSIFPIPTPSMTFSEWRTLWHCQNYALDIDKPQFVYAAAEHIARCDLQPELRQQLNIQLIWAYLSEKKLQEAGELLHSYPVELLNKESSPLHFLYSCWLLAAEGEELASIHIGGSLNIPFPRSWMLASHFLAGNITPDSPWFAKAFLWEKRQLYRQLSLFYLCANNKAEEDKYRNLYRQQFIREKL